jgi:hypothetical protein
MKCDLDLTRFGNRLMDGLLFCKRVNDWFEQIQSGPNGKERLRLRKGLAEKKLVEELLPIAKYIQARYGPGRRLKVRWLLGDQRYDARLITFGGFVDHGFIPKQQFIEVTSVVHENDHLLRKALHEGIPTFGVKGVSLDRKTKTISSRPYVYTNSEPEEDLVRNIAERIKAKDAIAYPADTILVIQVSWIGFSWSLSGAIRLSEYGKQASTTDSVKSSFVIRFTTTRQQSGISSDPKRHARRETSP